MQVRQSPGDTGWFVHDRFGLFIHWGLYALPARHEWVMQKEETAPEQYERYFDYFDPDLYDPTQWAEVAAAAGMKYCVVTSKHHEGFCLWDSALTDYKAPNSPAGRDLLRPLVEAFRAEGLRVGFYHSVIDWHHPQFVIDDVHALRNHPQRTQLNQQRDQTQYVEYLHGQVRELLTDFGHLDILWCDFSYPERGKGRADWDSPRLYRMIRELQPHVMLNDRMDLDDGWDVRTPEQWQPQSWITVDGQPVVWEACQTFSGSWGYHRDEASWKSVDQLVRMLVDTVSKGGNLLLNVGPTGRGELDRRALERLRGMGAWMRRHSRSIYGCTQAPAEFAVPADCRLTYHPEQKRLYVHLFAWPFRHLHLPGYAGKIAYAQLLNDASEVSLQAVSEHHQRVEGVAADSVVLELPVLQPDTPVPVIELFLR
jgi:alpha-L-fucosidase